MASIQTQVLVDNEWVTRTVSVEELLTTPTKTANTTHRKPPNFGVFTRTVIESPIVRWVLPAQLRSSRLNDVALVGEQSVQICELSSDSQLRPIAEKLRFGSRIRNCRVMGTHDYLRRKREDTHATYHRSDDVEATFSGSSIPSTPSGNSDMFQQILVLVLSTGELVFLFMSPTANGDWEFASSHSSILSGRLVDPGFHMAISPDGGYLALACSEHLFIVYQLASIEELRKQHGEGQPIQPIVSSRARSVKGIIHKFDFLHPSPENVSHVILLIITIQLGVPKLAIYDWENSEPLQEALDGEKPGHRFDAAAGLPLLVIPLTVCCQFLVITERSMAICSDVLGGPPTFAPFELARRASTDWHHGTHSPMWTAWTRPPREEPYHANDDLIYIAREDGWVNCLHITGDSGVESNLYYGPMGCNIDSGFASLSTTHGEILVAGGEHGPGAIWRIHARENVKLIDPLPNWSPTLDLVPTRDVQKPKKPKKSPKKLAKKRSFGDESKRNMRTPERIFACSGRGVSGALVEMRYGIQAKIGLDLSYTSSIKKCWAIPSFDSTPDAGFSMLLGLPEHSALLHISHDLSEVSERSQDTVDFDLLSTTLAVHISRDIVIQITTTHATIVYPDSCYQHLLSDMIADPLASITDSAVNGEHLALSVYSHSTFNIMVFTFDNTRFILNHVFPVEDDVTALSVNTSPAGACVLAGLSRADLSTLAIFPINTPQLGGQSPAGTQPGPIVVRLRGAEDVESIGINAITSIVCLGDEKIVVGRRNGDVLTINHRSRGDPEVTRTNHFGLSPSYVFPGMVFDTGYSTLVCNDAGLAIMKESKGISNLGSFKNIFRVWLTDANEPQSQSPTIHSVVRLDGIPDYGDSTWAMVAGSRILITELQPHPAPVPRYMPTQGTPSNLLYSERLEALVTVIVKNGIPSLHFFDPATGADLSHPIRKSPDKDDEESVDVDYITYLGTPDIKIASLLSWRYKNKGHLYEWFVILARSGDRQGRLLVVSAEAETPITNAGASRRIRFWTQFSRKIKGGAPRSGVTDDDGLFLNFGTTLEYHVIENKKFKTAMTYDLPSPATSLEVVSGYLYALTTHHSLVILDYKSDTAIESQRMVQLYTDEVARNGLHSIEVGLFAGVEELRRLILVSDPMCGVYGLWSPDLKSGISNMQLTFRAHLSVSVRKFVHGYTRPRWARGNSRYRYGAIQTHPDLRDILGLAIDGSLTQFLILREHEWRFLRYIQNLAMASKEICVVPRAYDSTDDFQLDPSSIAKTKMHIDGDILQRCAEKRALERIVSTPQQLSRLGELLEPLDLGVGMASPPAPDEILLAYEHAYGVLDHFLFPAL
ncbi:hypothetical protein NUW58_g6626 [Xylaria curta]|uniref:Uncharacterized protein n=1 Tax=Xylaria curta TaxID=42375 RepID=A0ACC1NRF3_9PEZI|nr:hypothetical protein NUW58_g6626 [Xylaria curta]